MTDEDTSRRRFLLGTGVAISTTGLAGCGIPGGGEEEDEEKGGDGEEGGDEEEEQLQAPESQ